MNGNSKLVVIMLVALGLAATSTGCSMKKSGSDGDEAVAADTANVDAAPATVETLPTDGQSTDQPTDPNAAAPTPAGTGEMATYQVKSGDTLMKIAFNLYGDISRWKSLYEMNQDVLKDANVLVSGMNLKYDKPVSEPAVERNGEPYLIKKGDTLGTIADDVYAKKEKWKKIWDNNRTLIKNPNRIYSGFYLYYQITEEEKREAEQIKATRGTTTLGATGAPSADPLAQPAPAAAPTQDPAAAAPAPGGMADPAAAPAVDARDPASK